MSVTEESSQQARTLINAFLTENGLQIARAYELAEDRYETHDLVALLNFPIEGHPHIVFTPRQDIDASVIGHKWAEIVMSTEPSHPRTRAHWLLAFGAGLGDVQVLSQIGVAR